MPRRKIDLDIKVEFMRESLHLVDLKTLLRKYDISERTAYNWYREVLDALPGILADEQPGRKSQAKAESAPPF
jgi:hypothetical protein